MTWEPKDEVPPDEYEVWKEYKRQARWWMWFWALQRQFFWWAGGAIWFLIAVYVLVSIYL